MKKIEIEFVGGSQDGRTEILPASYRHKIWNYKFTSVTIDKNGFADYSYIQIQNEIYKRVDMAEVLGKVSHRFVIESMARVLYED